MTAVSLFYPKAPTVVTADALAVSLELILRLEAKLREVTADAMRLAEERDDALAELAKTSADFHDVRESRDKVIEERERARQACNTCWHDLERIVSLCERIADEDPLKIAERMMRERDEARAKAATYDRALLAIQNVAMLAKRLRKTDPENAEHLLRFCREAGWESSILRGDECLADNTLNEVKP